MQYEGALLKTLLAWLLLVLAGCGPVTIRDTASQAFIPVEGWQLELHQDITIAANRTRVFLQEGRLVYATNDFKPHCQLRVSNIADRPRTVSADTFAIGRVFGSIDQVVGAGHIQLAASRPMVIADGGDGNGESRIIHFYLMTLESERQPDVSFLVCGGLLDDPPLSEYPTLQDIRSSLGDYASLIPPSGGGE